MEYLITTVVIMLFCITALARSTSSDNIIMLARPKPQPPKPGSLHQKPGTKLTKTLKFISPAVLQVLVGSPRTGVDINILLPGPNSRQPTGLMPIAIRNNGQHCTPPPLYLSGPDYYNNVALILSEAIKAYKAVAMQLHNRVMLYLKAISRACGIIAQKII